LQELIQAVIRSFVPLFKSSQPLEVVFKQICSLFLRFPFLWSAIEKTDNTILVINAASSDFAKFECESDLKGYMKRIDGEHLK